MRCGGARATRNHFTAGCFCCVALHTAEPQRYASAPTRCESPRKASSRARSDSGDAADAAEDKKMRTYKKKNMIMNEDADDKQIKNKKEENEA